jgi:L-cysteine S-thiosulfotransferase
MRRATVLVAVLAGACAAPPAAEPRRSGFDDMSPALQALQRDDTQNPAMLWVREGEALWSRAAANGMSCAGCHAGTALQNVAAHYPAFDAARNRPVSLAARIDQCRQRHLRAVPQGPDDAEVLALAAWLAHRARGQPLAPPADDRLAPWRVRGERLWQQRLGQLNLACMHCHDQRAGQRLGGTAIPQGHPTGYPIYRLEWQTLGSLQRRLRGCLVGVRAEPFAADADEWAALEVFLTDRARGLTMEGAAVRP